MLKKTPLHATHIKHGAKMVAFHGWDMPLNYGSQIKEHEAVRTNAGLFDVSHMTILDILGAGGRQFLRKLLTNDVDKLHHAGQALYSCMCNEHGGILDDLIVYQRAPDSFRLILNSATRDQVLPWIQGKSAGFSTGLQERHELAMLAVQGPNAITKTAEILSPAAADAVLTLGRFESVELENHFFARTGYTGEDGLEIILPQEDIASFWQQLIEKDIVPCGLAARDTLRLEAGLMLYGQDMDTSHTPLNSGLSWTIAWEPSDRNFIGMEALQNQKRTSVKQKMVGLTLLDSGVMRTGQTVFVDDTPVGVVTSGSYSPTLKQSIALARVKTDLDETKTSVEIRDKKHPVAVGKPRFLTSS